MVPCYGRHKELIVDVVLIGMLGSALDGRLHTCSAFTLNVVSGSSDKPQPSKLRINLWSSFLTPVSSRSGDMVHMKPTTTSDAK